MHTKFLPYKDILLNSVQPSAAERLGHIDANVDLCPGQDAMCVFDDETGAITLHFAPEHENDVVMYVHEMAHALICILCPWVEPGPRAETAAWAVTARAQRIARKQGLPMAKFDAGWEIHRHTGDLSKRVSMGVGRYAETLNPCSMYELIRRILNGSFEDE